MASPIRVVDLPLAGTYRLEPRVSHDERGAFVQLWSVSLLADYGLASDWTYTAFARNALRGTLRGLHYQIAPYAERKLVTCVHGSVWDVLLDLRSGSPTYGRWHGETLSGKSLETLYIPEGVAHGYISLEDDSVVGYHISAEYSPEAASGVRWDDPAFAIDWPLTPLVMSQRDRSFPLRTPEKLA
jgi:dTDP-4-dehydrorhamnose 3,5-epimerase